MLIRVAQKMMNARIEEFGQTKCAAYLTLRSCILLDETMPVENETVIIREDYEGVRVEFLEKGFHIKLEKLSPGMGKNIDEAILSKQRKIGFSCKIGDLEAEQLTKAYREALCLEEL
ncbi:hypothetical protein HDU89_008684 [Geranomyces variabilis]|nr:hypothetical protein HDU89_008684 [Geranomyces variabilis]